MKKVTSLKTILKMLEKKYSSNEHSTPAMIIYDDGSGMIVKNVLVDDLYAPSNCLSYFNDIEELVKELQEN